jgi:hypothetical protein
MMDQSKTPRHDCRSCRYLTWCRWVLDLSIIQSPFSITKCQILDSRFATFASLYHLARSHQRPHQVRRRRRSVTRVRLGRALLALLPAASASASAAAACRGRRRCGVDAEGTLRPNTRSPQHAPSPARAQLTTPKINTELRRTVSDTNSFG